MIRRRILAAGLVLTAMAAAGVATGWAQERPAGVSARQARRVPAFFGQIGITPQQREQIYTIRAEHDAKIAELERQLLELKAAEMAACEGVLTPAQKQLLGQLRAARGYGSRGGVPAFPPAAAPAPPSLNNAEAPPAPPADPAKEDKAG